MHPWRHTHTHTHTHTHCQNVVIRSPVLLTGLSTVPDKLQEEVSGCLLLNWVSGPESERKNERAR